MFPPTSLPVPNELLLVTDQLASPADFLLHLFLAAHLKQSKDAKCLILSLSESATRWKVLAGKANINLPQYISSGAVVIVNDLPRPSTQSIGDLRALFEVVEKTLSQWTAGTTPGLVIIDDLSVLEWMGFSAQEVWRFIRALQSACRRISIPVIVRYHDTTPGEPDDLVRLLLPMCAHHMEVLPLSSGRSGSVSGEIALYPSLSITNPTYKPIPRSSAIQYRLTDTSCVFFERGTGNNVL
ncbi:hypothetical protein EIP91_008536 [Steccherinum ochraceum]|uniref:Elongator complex protein 5 n=1 Tax=Steccherinum ochraceum TaxID=92696 RepID=A0A4R0R2R5_9APHY|nr:hypothetical protein EIP91_008536 [Steccherinum ochraceum]